MGWFSGSDDQKKSPVTTINGKPVTDPQFAIKTPTVVPATPPPLPKTPALASSNVSAAQDAAAKQRKRATAGDLSKLPGGIGAGYEGGGMVVPAAPAPRFHKMTLVGGG